MTPTSAQEHTEQVCDSFDCSDARLAEIIQAAVRHLHAFADEVQLSREEWKAGIEFLTAVGQRCDQTRQEFILLSDVLGLSMMLEMIQAAPSPGATEPTVLGPFYVPDAPERVAPAAAAGTCAGPPAGIRPTPVLLLNIPPGVLLEG